MAQPSTEHARAGARRSLLARRDPIFRHVLLGSWFVSICARAHAHATTAQPKKLSTSTNWTKGRISRTTSRAERLELRRVREGVLAVRRHVVQCDRRAHTLERTSGFWDAHAAIFARVRDARVICGRAQLAFSGSHAGAGGRGKSWQHQHQHQYGETGNHANNKVVGRIMPFSASNA